MADRGGPELAVRRERDRLQDDAVADFEGSHGVTAALDQRHVIPAVDDREKATIGRECDTPAVAPTRLALVNAHTLPSGVRIELEPAHLIAGDLLEHTR